MPDPFWPLSPRTLILGKRLNEGILEVALTLVKPPYEGILSQTEKMWTR